MVASPYHFEMRFMTDNVGHHFEMRFMTDKCRTHAHPPPSAGDDNMERGGDSESMYAACTQANYSKDPPVLQRNKYII